MELTGDRKRYSSRGTRWKDSRRKHCILSCYQVNTLCAIVGRGSLPLATKPLGHEGDGEAKRLLARSKKKGRDGGWGLRQKRKMFYSLLCLSSCQSCKAKKKGGGGIFSSPICSLSSVLLLLMFYKQIKQIDPIAVQNAWPRLAYFTTAIPSSTSPYCFQTMPKGLKARERSPPQEWGSPSGETADFSGHLWGYRTLPSNDSKLDLCLDPARFNNVSYLVHRASLRTDF